MPAAPVEARAQPELHRRRQRQLPPAVQHEVDAEQRQQHRRGQRQGEQGGDGHRPPFRQAAGRRGGLHGVVSHGDGGVTGLDHGGGGLREGHRRVGCHGRLLRRQIHRCGTDAGHFQQGFLHPRHAGCAGHALNPEGQFAGIGIAVFGVHGVLHGDLLPSV